MEKEIAELFTKLRYKKPLVHQITNFVTMNDCANVTLAIGASPVMASSPCEAGEMVMLSEALVINIGTLQPESFDGMMAAGKTANSKGIPVVFDPVGAGATAYRTDCAMKIMKEITPAIVRGNASEMNRLIGGHSITKGVDAVHVALSNADIARTVAATYNCIAVVSGEEDAVSNGKHTYLIQNGHPMLTRVTGTGCMSSALIGCFAALSMNHLHSAVAGISLMGIAGELAAASLSDEEGTGTFRVRLVDFISHMSAEMWLEGVRIIEA